ncbi:MAG: ParA family protein [Chloroflexota bacterium]
MTNVIAVVSHKGGTGKTSFVQNLAYELAATRRVLAVDFDPQANLTLGCGFDPAAERTTVYHTLHDATQTKKSLLATENGRFHLLPSHLDLALAEQVFAAHYDRNDKLKDVIGQVKEDYDIILIDSPPSLGFFAFNILTAANQAIIPLQCQPYAFQAVDNTLQLIQLVQKGNSSLTLKAIVLNLYDRRVTLTQSVENAARQRFGDLIPQTVIPTNVSVAEASLDGAPVGIYAPQSAGAKAYKRLAAELYGA